MGINVGLVMNCAGIFYTPVSSTFGVSVGKFGIYTSMIYLFSTLTLSIAGKLIDKYGAILLLTINSFILGLCLMIMSCFDDVWQFYIAGAIIDITMAFLLYLSFSILINRWFKTRVGFFIGICSASSGVGGILFNPFGAFLINNYGWRIAYLIFGLIIVLFVSPVLGILLRSYPEDKGLKLYGFDVKQNKNIVSIGFDYKEAVKSIVFL